MLTGKKFSEISIWLHDFIFVVYKNLWLLGITLLAFGIAIPFSTAGLGTDSIFNIEYTHQQLKYRFIYEDILSAVQIMVIIAGILFALIIFHFIHDKKETTIFFALGISRNRLLFIRNLTGILFLIISVGVPMFISFILNYMALGNYSGMIRACLYCSGGLILTGSIAFFVTEIACFIAGTLMEAIVYAVGFLAIPSILCIGCNWLMQCLYWGNTAGVYAYTGSEMIRESLLDSWSGWNPILFFYAKLQEQNSFNRPLETSVPPALSLDVLWKWCIVLCVLILIGWWMFRIRKAEAAEISGSYRIFAEVIIFIVCFGSGCGIFTFLAEYQMIFALVFAIFAFLLIHLFFRKSIFSYQTSIKTSIVSVTLHILMFLLVLGGVKTGGFGIAYRVLDKNDFVKAQISYVGAPAHLTEEAAGSSSNNSYYIRSNSTFDTAEDIQTIIALQQGFIRTGKQELQTDTADFKNTVIPYDIEFTYEDAQGKNYCWYYDRASMQQLHDLLLLEDTDTRQQERQILLAGDSQDTQTDTADMLWTEQAYQTGTIYMMDSFYQHTWQLDINEEQRQALLKAAAQDEQNRQSEDYYYPASMPKCVLMFSQNGEYDCEYYSYHLENAFWYLTDNDKHVLSFLEDNQLLKLVPDIGEEYKQIESITLQKFDPYIGINGMKEPLSMCFMAYCALGLDDFMVQKDFGKKYTITDTNKIADLADGLRSFYYMNDGGYLAAVKLTGGDKYVYLFLPAENVPDFVKG